MKIKGRGALSNPVGRFAHREYAPTEEEVESVEGLPTQLHVDVSRTIIARNRSPDLPFSQSINPYRGCEHGCIYCYARPTHAYLDLSPGRDFETQLYFKPQAAKLLRAELTRADYDVSPIALGTNTDPYQPIERKLEITRSLLELLLELRHPLTIVTKGALILRDLDLLAGLAADKLVSVMVSLTTLDEDLKRRMEPRTAGPQQRLGVVRELAGHGIPTGVLLAPIIPGLNDHELEHMVQQAAECGAHGCGYVLLRLPYEVKPLFIEWLREHYPDRAEHVLSLLRQMRGGELNDPRFHSRQRGAGPFADLLRSRFERARRVHGLDDESMFDLNTGLFRRPRRNDGQLELWGS
ncbi:MAG TPA: PA0069 family radical SAM protein [Gammaproteobacteria bacterium]|nr:PA0069 family radical SAM protein [Gammaproteobacteria bacterium]